MSSVENRKSRILVVDDEQGVRQCLGVLLALEGYDVETAPDATSAMMLFAGQKFDLVLTDYTMPSMNGDELAMAMRARVPNQRIVMVTAEADVLVRSGKVPVGIDQLIRKPFGLADLRRAIDAALAEPKSGSLRVTQIK